MTPQELWGKLPSIAELSAHPRVRDAVERLNRSQTLARVRTAVEDLAAEAARRAEQWQGVGPGDLVELVLRKLERPTASSTAPVINATGELWGPHVGPAPLAAAALEAVAQQASEYAPPRHTDETSAERSLRTLTAAEAALVTPSLATAVAAVLRGVAAESSGVLVVARCEVADVDHGVRLAGLCQELGLALDQVGDADRVTTEDYAAACARRRESGAARPALYRRIAETYAVVGGTPRPDSAAVVAGVGPSGAIVIEDLAGSPPIEAVPSGGCEWRTAEHALRGGADLVLLRGDGFVGGPRSGIVLGRKELIDAVRAQGGVTSASRNASPLVDAMLAATVELYRDPQRLPFTHPLWGLVDTPLENLQTRAQRLAPQIAAAAQEPAAAGDVAAAEAIAIDASEARPRGLVRLPSWGVRLQAAKTSPETLAQRLADGSPRVLARLDGDAVVLDLRTVFPRQEGALVAAVAGARPGAREP
ncbi:MAG: hypothetical protein ACRCT8_06340 [Lacipirellulaceae bacterium]